MDLNFYPFRVTHEEECNGSTIQIVSGNWLCAGYINGSRVTGWTEEFHNCLEQTRRKV